MTIIAYKDGEMWADDIITANGGLIVGRELKTVRRKKDGALAGASGDSSACGLFLKWAASGRGKPPEVFTGDNSTSGAIIVTRDGIIHDYSGPEPSYINADCYAVGMGCEIALGAMHHGASAKEAVVIACQAYGWPAVIHGVNHEGQWFEYDTRTLPEAIHHKRTATLPSSIDRRRT